MPLRGPAEGRQSRGTKQSLETRKKIAAANKGPLFIFRPGPFPHRGGGGERGNKGASHHMMVIIHHMLERGRPALPRPGYSRAAVSVYTLDNVLPYHCVVLRGGGPPTEGGFEETGSIFSFSNCGS
jgi:hypothetical protein